MAHPVDLFIHRGVLLDEGVGARDIGFRLVIIIITDEIFDGIIRKEAAELGVELCRQCFIRGHDEGGALRGLNDFRHGEGLA